MTRQSIFVFTIIFCIISSCQKADEEVKFAESFVFINETPDFFLFPLDSGRIEVRSTYNKTPNTIYYQEGKDYIIDKKNNSIQRTPLSKIPNYSNHPLFNKAIEDKDYGADSIWKNTKYFTYVAYNTAGSNPIADTSDQSAFLKNTKQKLLSGKPLNICWYGDSVTSGGEASETKFSFTYIYEQHLKNTFPQSQIVSQNLSIPGYGTPEAVSWFEGKFTNQHPDIVFIGFGLNDQSDEGTAACEPAVFQKNLVLLAKMIKERFNADVVFFSTFPPNDRWIHNTHRMEQYTAASKQAAQETNSAYIAVYETWMKVLSNKRQEALLANNINHPNDFGHWIYAQSFMAMKF